MPAVQKSVLRIHLLAGWSKVPGVFTMSEMHWLKRYTRRLKMSTSFRSFCSAIVCALSTCRCFSEPGPAYEIDGDQPTVGGRHYHLRLTTELVYLAIILDGYSRKVVGWSLDRSLASGLAVAALEKAIALRQPLPGLVHHSDRGVQYASEEYVAVLEKPGMIPRMSRPANP